LAEKFIQLRPEAKVLFISGYTVEPVALPGKAGESVPFIAKTFLPSDLARKVGEVLGHRPQDS
jgi:hypothetical protein